MSANGFRMLRLTFELTFPKDILPYRLSTEDISMRATLAWLFTVSAGFAMLMALMTLALIPGQAAKNRLIYAVVDQYADRLNSTNIVPANPEVDDAFAASTRGVRIWRSLPGGCQDGIFEKPSDRFVLGFWQNGSPNRFGGVWWYCFSYPSRSTTMPLTTTDYLNSAAGKQVVAYVLLAGILGFVAFHLRARRGGGDLKPLTKAIWLGAFMQATFLFDRLQDSGDDQFFQSPEYIKWFTFALENTIGWLTDKITGILSISSYAPPFAVWILEFLTWVAAGWVAVHLLSSLRTRSEAE